MLQKYVNGVAQEEYKQGELISDYEYDTFNECNEGNQNPDEDIEDFIYQWVVVSGTYVCDGTNKYQEEKEQRSSDNGATWQDTGRTRQGSLIEVNSTDCGYIEYIYRWITESGTYICDGNNKYQKQKEQRSSDNGVTWEDTGNTRRGSLIEADSEDCGYGTQYLTFVALEDGTFSFTQNNIQYSLDNGSTWATLSVNTQTPTVTTGNKIMWKAENPTIADSNGIGTFSSTGRFDVEGNAMSLLYSDNFVNQTSLSGKTYVFTNLFRYNANVVNAANLILPATTLADWCYIYMFDDCTSLVTAPLLPATTLAFSCYQNMFYRCSSLVNAPELPAMTLVEGCYFAMFAGCTSLVTAPQLPATTLAQACYQDMFMGCTSLVTAPSLPAMTLAGNCYTDMFAGCSSLVNAPVLSATTLAQRCYAGMFQLCSSLHYIKCLATDISAEKCTNRWVYGVTQTSTTGTFVKAPSMSSWTTGQNGIPSGWTVQDASS